MDEERLVLLVPWVGAALALVIGFFPRSGSHSGLSLELWGMLAGLFFLDGVHVIYSFLLLFSLPELKGWAARRPAFWIKLGGVAAALATAFYFLRFSPLTSGLPWVVSLLFFIEAFGPSQHTLAQIRGISFCYHSSLRRGGLIDAGELPRAAKVEWIERRLFQVLLLGDICTALPKVAEYAQLGHSGVFSTMRAAGIPLIFVSACGIMLNACAFPKQEHTNKVFFLSRVILYPIRIYYGFAYVIIRVAHGTEYLSVFRRMVGNSRLSQERRSSVLRTAFWASLLYAPVYLLTFSGVIRSAGIWNEPQPLFLGALMLHLTVRYLHYYMDRTMFRMSRPETRKAVAPLLASVAPARGGRERIPLHQIDPAYPMPVGL